MKDFCKSGSRFIELLLLKSRSEQRSELPLDFKYYLLRIVCENCLLKAFKVLAQNMKPNKHFVFKNIQRSEQVGTHRRLECAVSGRLGNCNFNVSQGLGPRFTARHFKNENIILQTCPSSWKFS